MKKMMTTALLCSAVLSQAAMANEKPRNKMLDRMMYTINQDVKVAGPVYRDQASKEERNLYGTEMVRLILKRAHLKAQKYLEVDDTQAYYAFMTLALTVPLQEGLYIQYRGVQADVCKSDANSGELIRKAGEATYANFVTYLMGGEKPFIVPCEKIDATKEMTQIIRGHDGSDLSVMQVSIRWHFDDFLANKKYEDTVKTLDYGINHLMNGFEPVYRNVSDYKCIGSGGFLKKKKVDYINLIRGIWAGKYNSGSIAKTCRFAELNSEYKHHDKGFEKNLNKVLDFNGVIGSGGDLDFKIADNVAAALKEVVTNLKNKTNDRTNLDKLLAE